MNPVLKDILDLLNVENIERNLFRGRNAAESEHVFGGQVLAQAIAAANRTVEDARQIHSVHAYFLRPGDHRLPILYDVDRIRDGASFTTRRVAAIQHGRAIFSLAASWQKHEDGLTHTVAMPNVPAPHALRSDRDAYAALAKERPEVKRFAFRFDAIDSRQVENILMTHADAHPPRKHTWLKTRDRLPDDPEVHLCMLAYMSDLDFMSTSMLPHGITPGNRQNMQGASLDHALWFHRPFRADEWLLFAKTSPSAAGARGFVRGQFFTEQGELVATAAQECLIRIRQPEAQLNE
jgi:acyl-CoA thioesterase-2